MEVENESQRSNSPIPNSVGRLDPITEAIRWNRYDEVESLLNSEIDRLKGRLKAIEKEQTRDSLRLAEVKVFLQMYRLSGDFRMECERVCCGQTTD